MNIIDGIKSFFPFFIPGTKFSLFPLFSCLSPENFPLFLTTNKDNLEIIQILNPKQILNF